MPEFVKNTWKDRVSDHPGRRRLIDVNTGTSKLYDVVRADTATTDGTRFNANNMNGLENRIYNALNYKYGQSTPNPAYLRETDNTFHNIPFNHKEEIGGHSYCEYYVFNKIVFISISFRGGISTKTTYNGKCPAHINCGNEIPKPDASIRFGFPLSIASTIGITELNSSTLLSSDKGLYAIMEPISNSSTDNVYIKLYTDWDNNHGTTAVQWISRPSTDGKDMDYKIDCAVSGFYFTY